MTRALTVVPEDRPGDPPQNVQAEQALLGAILVANRAYDHVGAFLRPHHFVVPVHGRIFAAIEGMIGQGMEANPITLMGAFKDDEDLKALGNHAYLGKLAASAVTVVNAKDYGETILQLHLRRELVASGENLVNRAWNQEDVTVRAEEIAYGAQVEIEQIVSADRAQAPRSAAELVAESIALNAEAVATRGASLFVPTGIDTFDQRFGGLPRGELVIVGARPAMGKTVFGGQVALNAARAGYPVLFSSIEMRGVQVMRRIVCGEAGIISGFAEYQRMEEDERARWDAAYAEAGAAIGKLPLRVQDLSSSLTAITTHAAAACRAGGCALVVVDYLGLVDPPERYFGNKNAELGQITRALKLGICNRFGIPVVVLHQLSRRCEEREDHRPRLSDLRDSGEIEQDAGMVIFLYREHYYASRKQNRTPPEEADLRAIESHLDLIVAKHRHGRANETVKTEIDLKTSRVGARQRALDLPEGAAEWAGAQ